jgi:hypothetical protein
MKVRHNETRCTLAYLQTGTKQRAYKFTGEVKSPRKNAVQRKRHIIQQKCSELLFIELFAFIPAIQLHFLITDLII